MKYYQPQFFKPTLFKSGILIFFKFIFISLHMKILFKKNKKPCSCFQLNPCGMLTLKNHLTFNTQSQKGHNAT